MNNKLLAEIAEEVEEIEPLEYNFKIKEDVFFQMIGGEVEFCVPMHSPDHGELGMASYYHYEGGCLDYGIETELDPPKKDGCYVAEGADGVYTEGDGWLTDDDMSIYCEKIRPATEEEVKQWL